MKTSNFFLVAITLVLTACGTSPVVTVTPVITKVPPITQTVAIVPTTRATETPPPPAAATPTIDPGPVATSTSSSPETCPQADSKLRPSFGPVFKDKKAAYHDARQVVLDFLNAGGDPKTAIDKLAENDVTGTQIDVTNDGVAELFLPSGYLTIFGCRGGKYQTLLDIPPTDDYNAYAAIPLVIQDLNHNGVPEIFLAQVLDYRVKYSILEWNGGKLSSITPITYGKSGDHVYIEYYDIYTIGESNAEQGKINGNWEIVDTDNNGLKEIVIKAGVYVNFFESSNLEEQITLAWEGDRYIVQNFSIESTPTRTPTSTPLPFSATCSYKTANLKYQYNASTNNFRSLSDYLNAGGNPEQLKSFFSTKIQDLTNDGLPDVLVMSNVGYHSWIYAFTCVNGKYQDQLGIGDSTDRFGGGTFTFDIVAIQDINKNRFPEIVIKDIGCINFNCGAIYIAEWDGTKLAGLIKDKDSQGEIDYAETNNLQDAYLKDLDLDGIPELVWVGGVPRKELDQSGLPWRLETHVYKWDGKNYNPQLIEYSAPLYRFQAVQDGDRFALADQFEKALKSYQIAINNENLGWWTQARQDYLLFQYGIGNCTLKDAHCHLPTPDPNERPVLSAYATYRIMLTQIMMNKSNDAKSTYENLLSTYPVSSSGYRVVGMATSFWSEYEASQNVGSACSKAINYAAIQTSILAYIGSGYHGWQSKTYKPDDICPFK